MFNQIVTSILGSDACDNLLQGKIIAVVLHQDSINELSPYLDFISNIGTVMPMGAGNRLGNSIEDKKRPYGIGIGFMIKKK